MLACKKDPEDLESIPIRRNFENKSGEGDKDYSSLDDVVFRTGYTDKIAPICHNNRHVSM
jgi:hypothetical protein